MNRSEYVFYPRDSGRLAGSLVSRVLPGAILALGAFALAFYEPMYKGSLGLSAGLAVALGIPAMAVLVLITWANAHLALRDFGYVPALYLSTRSDAVLIASFARRLLRKPMRVEAGQPVYVQQGRMQAGFGPPQFRSAVIVGNDRVVLVSRVSFDQLIPRLEGVTSQFGISWTFHPSEPPPPASRES